MTFPKRCSPSNQLLPKAMFGNGFFIDFCLLIFQFVQIAKKSVWLVAFLLVEKLTFEPKWRELFALVFGLLTHKFSNKQPTSTTKFTKHFCKQLA